MQLLVSVQSDPQEPSVQITLYLDSKETPFALVLESDWKVASGAAGLTISMAMLVIGK